MCVQYMCVTLGLKASPPVRIFLDVVLVRCQNTFPSHIWNLCLSSFCVCAVEMSGGLFSSWLFLESVGRMCRVYFCQPASICPVSVSDVCLDKWL